MEWLLGKAQSYEARQNGQSSSGPAGQAWSPEQEEDPEEEEEPFEEYAPFEPEAELEDPFDIFAEQLTKHENREFLKFHKTKSVVHTTNQQLEAQREKVESIKAKTRARKKQRMSSQRQRNRTHEYKDIEIKDRNTQESKSQRGEGSPREPPSESSHCRVVVIGPSQTGKSTLCGQILFRMGLVQKAELNRCIQYAQKHKDTETEEKGADAGGQWPQYIMDISEDERKQGCSLEMAKAVFANQDTVFTFLDTPGQESLSKSILDGAALAEIAILVVSAKKFELKQCLENDAYQAQIREQLRIAHGQGIQQLVVAVNKMETMKWAKNKYYEIRNCLEKLAEDVGFLRQNLEFLPISALSGANVLKPVQQTDSLKCSWYCGRSLLEILNQKVFVRDDFQHDATLERSEKYGLEPAQKESPDLLLMDIYDKFFNEKRQLFIQCLIKNGELHRGDKLTLLPQNLPVQALQIQDCKEKTVQTARRGELVTIELNVSDEQSVQVGTCYLTHRGQEGNLTLSNKVYATVQIFGSKDRDHLSKRYISNGLTAMLHKGSLRTQATIERLTVVEDLENQVQKPRLVVEGPAKVQCKLVLSDAIALQRYDSFLLRDSDKNETFAAGKILKYAPFVLPAQPAPITPELLRERKLQEAKRVREAYRNSGVHLRLAKTL